MGRLSEADRNNPRKQPMPNRSIRYDRETDARLGWLAQHSEFSTIREALEEGVHRLFSALRRRKGHGELTDKELDKYSPPK